MEIIETAINIYSFDTILNAINELIQKGYPFINTKRIRYFLKIKASNRSKINFIWRSLEYLKEKGFIEIYSNKSPKVYKLPRKVIEV